MNSSMKQKSKSPTIDKTVSKLDAQRLAQLILDIYKAKKKRNLL
jgi:hypothetical protein